LVIEAAGGGALRSSSKGGEGPWLLERRVWVGLGALLAAPLCCLPTLDPLKFTSVLSLVCVALLVAVVVAGAAAPEASGVGTGQPSEGSRGGDSCGGMEGRGRVEAFVLNGETLSKLTVFVFSFTCHQNIFSIVNELKSSCQVNPCTDFSFSFSNSSFWSQFKPTTNIPHRSTYDLFL
jgi:amino acid permease